MFPNIENMVLGNTLARISDIQKKIGLNNNNKPMVNNNHKQGEFASLLEAENVKNNSMGKNNSFMKDDIVRMIQLASKKYGVDERLVLAVAETESGFKADAVSEAGAEGVMQLMPETARSLGIFNAKDPRENIDGGVRYLKKLLNEFDGDLKKTLAAYNAGPTAVNRYGGVPPYKETKEYVDKVLTIYNR